jgi:hypothetical protein
MQAKVCLRYSYRLCNGLQNNKTSHIFVPGYIACIVDNYCLRIWVSEEKIKMWKANRRRTPSDGKSSPCLWQGELKKNYPRNISARFDFKWFSGFREELFKIAQVQSGLLFRNLVGSIYGRSSIKDAHFVPNHLQTWPPQAILVSDWLISKKSSPLKLLGLMNQNLLGSIRGEDFFRNRPIRNKNGLWRQCLLTDRDEMSNL